MRKQTGRRTRTGHDVYRSTDNTAIVAERNRILDVPVEKLSTYVQAILRDGTRLDPSPAVEVTVK